MEKIKKYFKELFYFEPILFSGMIIFAICFYIYSKGFPLLAILVAILFVPILMHDIIAKFYKGIVKGHIVKVKVQKR